MHRRQRAEDARAVRACVGARTCDLTEQLSGGANDFNKVLGDPCPMWRKFLKAEARCGVEKYRVAGVGQVCAASQGEVSEGKPALSLDDSLLEALLACCHAHASVEFVLECFGVAADAAMLHIAQKRSAELHAAALRCGRHI